LGELVVVVGRIVVVPGVAELNKGLVGGIFEVPTAVGLVVLST
jgi:hypothetical protein